MSDPFYDPFYDEFPVSGSGWSPDPERDAENRETAEINTQWLTLEAGAARAGISPRQLQRLGKSGILEVRKDSSGRERISPDTVRFVRRYAKDDRMPSVDFPNS